MMGIEKGTWSQSVGNGYITTRFATGGYKTRTTSYYRTLLTVGTHANPGTIKPELLPIYSAWKVVDGTLSNLDILYILL